MRTLLIAAALISSSQDTAKEGPNPSSRVAAEPMLPIPYKNVDGWDIMIDMDLEHSCFVMGRFETGTTIRLGIDRVAKSGLGYLVVANPSWDGYKDGGDYDLVIQFDDQKPWKSRATASTLTGITSLITTFSSQTFARDFAVRQAMFIRHHNKEIARLDLAASNKAIASMMTCQVEVDDTIAKLNALEAADEAEEKASTI